MNKICNGLLILLTTGFTSVSHAANFSMPEYQQFTLSNGLTIYMMEQKEVPLIDVSIIVKAGSVRDGNASGLSQITADTLLLGTEKLNKQQFEQELDFLGAQISSDASTEFSQMSLSMAAKDAKLLLPLLYDAVALPAFDEQQFENHKSRYNAGLAQQQESPSAMIKGYFDALLYQGHPYANNHNGTVTTVEAISLDKVKAFHAKWYNPDNSALVVVGDFDSKKIRNQIAKLFGSWKGKTPSSVTPALPQKEREAQVLLVNKGDAKESTFMIGGPGIRYSNPDFTAVSVVNTILGGRFTSWLNSELRVNSGLTYGARSRFDAKQLGGGFYISSFTQTATTTEAIDLAIDTYQRLWLQGIDKATLESAKSYVKGQFPPNYETSSQLSGLLSRMFIYGFDESFINTFARQVNQLNEEGVKQIIGKYFPKESLQFVVIGKADDIRDKVKKYGKLIETDIKAEFAL
jgi:zinc protease